MSGTAPRVARPAAPIPHGEYSLDLYRPGDEVEICRLFRQVFDRDKPLHHWQWQFRDNPAGQRIFLAKDAAGQVVAQFAGIPVRVRVDGEEHIFTQMVDSMVDPACRRGLRKHGIFAHLVEEYIRWFGGRYDSVDFGLPNPEALRIGRRFLGYEPIARVLFQVRDVTQRRATRVPPGLSWDVGARLPPDYDDLWARCQDRHRIETVRDRSYMSWRYEQCPAADYRFVALRRQAQLEALVVLKDCFLEPDCASLVDCVWDHRTDGVRRAALACAEAETRRFGVRHLVAAFSDASGTADLVAGRGYRSLELGHRLVGKSYDPSLSLERLRRDWWFSLGDFDLV